MSTTIEKPQVESLTLQELLQREQPLPKSWQKAAGILRNRLKAIEKHVKSVRREWERTKAKKQV